MKAKYKKIVSIILIINIFLSSFLFSGCFMDMGDGSGNSGSTGGGSSEIGGEEQPSQDEEQSDFTKFASGIKVSYSNTEENEELTKLVMSELKYISSEILLQLCGEYGKGLVSPSTLTLTESYLTDETVVGKNILDYVTTDMTPYMSYSNYSDSTRFSVTFENIENPITLPFETGLSQDEIKQNLLPYTHELAITGNNSLFDGVTSPSEKWKWSENGSNENVEANTFALNFTFNSLNYIKLSIALANIVLGKDLTISQNLDAYNNSIAVNDYETLNNNLTELCKTIQRTGIEQKEISSVQNFILSTVIGKEIVDYDNTNYDVYVNGVKKETATKVGFLNEEFYNIPTDPNEFYYYSKITKMPNETIKPLYQDINWNNTLDHDAETLCVRKDYFKNYSNTVLEIINRVIFRTDEEGKLVHQVGYLLKMRDMSSEDVTWKELEDDRYEVMTLPTQYQNYKNAIIMFKRDTKMESLWLAFDAKQALNLTVYARYYNADKGCYMTWLQEGNEFADSNGYTDTFKLSTVSVSAGEYSSSELFGQVGGDLEVDFKKLLTDVADVTDEEEEDDYITPSSETKLYPNFNDEKNSSTIIPKFANNFVCFDEIKEFMSYDNEYYNYTTSESGMLMTYKDTSTSFVELVFASDNDTPFRIGFMSVEPLQ